LKNDSAEFWRLFKALVPQQLAKLKIGSGRLDFAPETYRHSLGCNSCRFSSIRLNIVSIQFWKLFGAKVTTSAGPEKAKLITGPRWPSFAHETYPHCLRCSSYRLLSVLLKIVLVKFKRLFRAQASLEQVNWKTGPRWLSLHPKNTHIVCGDIHIVFSQTGWKMFRPNFDDFSKPWYHTSWQCWKSGLEDSISHPKHTDTFWGAIFIISRH